MARVKLADCHLETNANTQDTCIGRIGKNAVKIELGKEAELFFGVPDHFID